MPLYSPGSPEATRLAGGGLALARVANGGAVPIGVDLLQTRGLRGRGPTTERIRTMVADLNALEPVMLAVVARQRAHPVTPSMVADIARRNPRLNPELLRDLVSITRSLHDRFPPDRQNQRLADKLSLQSGVRLSQFASGSAMSCVPMSVVAQAAAKRLGHDATLILGATQDPGGPVVPHAYLVLQRGSRTYAWDTMATIQHADLKAMPLLFEAPPTFLADLRTRPGVYSLPYALGSSIVRQYGTLLGRG